MLAAGLALLASVMWGTADFGTGLLARRMSYWAAVLVSVVAGALAMLLVILVVPTETPSVTTLCVLGTGGILSTTSGFAYFHAVTFTKMSIAAPIVAGAAAVPVLWGLLRGEQPHLVQLVGIVATLVLIVLITLPGPVGPRDDMPVTLSGVVLAVAASVCAGLMIVALDHGAADDPIWAVAGVRWAGA